MKAVILGRGLETRVSEGTHPKQKPMIEIGGNSILYYTLKRFYHPVPVIK